MSERFSEAALARAFNAWMDEYVNHPERFSSTTEDALRHLRERVEGRAPTYGEVSAATLRAYLNRMADTKA
jgi:hypothetical protein